MIFTNLDLGANADSTGLADGSDTRAGAARTNEKILREARKKRVMIECLVKRSMEDSTTHTSTI
jgi:hypothetical protein